MEVVLFEPEIPPNTGNIARTCAAFGTRLHLVGQLGFKLEDRYLRRAGLDYWPNVELRVHEDWPAFCGSIKSGSRLVLLTTKSSTLLPSFKFHKDDYLIFGPETRGLPPEILAAFPLHIRIPSRRVEEKGVRSLNLSTACGIVLYAALANCQMLDQFS